MPLRVVLLTLPLLSEARLGTNRVLDADPSNNIASLGDSQFDEYPNSEDNLRMLRVFKAELQDLCVDGVEFEGTIYEEHYSQCLASSNKCDNPQWTQTSYGCKYNSQELAWSPLAESKSNTHKYACGAQVSVENWGRFNAPRMQGVRLYYCNRAGFDPVPVTVVQSGSNWQPAKLEQKKAGLCPEGSFIDGYRMDEFGFDIHCDIPKLATDDTMTGLWVKVWNETSTVSDVVYDGRYIKMLSAQNYTAYSGTGNNIRYLTNLEGVFYDFDFRVSREKVAGSWKSVGSGPGQPTIKVTESMTTTDGTEMSKEKQSGYQLAIEQKLEYKIFGAGGSTSISASYEEAQKTLSAVSSTLSKTRSEEFTVQCDGQSSSGIWYVWQYQLHQPAERAGDRPGFALESRHFLCTPEFVSPKCPLGFCADAMCQTCTGIDI